MMRSMQQVGLQRQADAYHQLVRYDHRGDEIRPRAVPLFADRKQGRHCHASSFGPRRSMVVVHFETMAERAVHESRIYARGPVAVVQDGTDRKPPLALSV